MIPEFDSSRSESGATGFSAAIEEAKALTEAGIAQAWRNHSDRVRDLLEAEWSERVSKIVRERFDQMENRLRTDFADAAAKGAQEDLERSAELARASARRDLAAQLNQFVRRLRQAGSREVWISVLLDTASTFCERAALFSTIDGALRGEAVRGGREASISQLEVPLSIAPAFANVVESTDTVVAMGTRRELSDSIAERMGDTSSKKVYLFPLLQDRQVVGILYAEPGEEPLDPSALELVTELAGNSMKLEEVRFERTPSGLVQIAGPEPGRWQRQGEIRPLPRPEQEAHLRAQRFARTKIAAMILHRNADIRRGRASRDLYASLGEEIDAGREAFERQFRSSFKTMPDYFHQELVRSLANGEPELLGPGYPGALS